MQLTELHASVLLNMVPEIGCIRAGKLVNYFGNASKIFDSTVEEICAAGEFTAEIASKVLKSRNNIDVDKEILKTKENGIEILIPSNRNYPQQLLTLQDYPQVLYVKGSLKNDDVYSVAVVGTRKPTQYGNAVTEIITKDFAKLQVTIVSGLARGIDTIAHKTALNNNARTIAVLGNGLGKHYPPENRKLEDKICAQGALISEFPFDYGPEKFNFPRRNRLIAGLSLGTIVIEGDEKSGTLITAKCALEQGKDVFAVPGSIFSKVSTGPHFLIKQGAKLIENANDVVDEISLLADWLKERSKSAVIESQHNEFTILNPLEIKILSILDDSPEGVNIDKLRKSSECSFGELSEALIALEIKQKLKSLPGKVYMKL